VTLPKEKFRFSYRFLDDLGGAVASLGLAIPLSRDVSALTLPQAEQDEVRQALVKAGLLK